jgi:hypothetical protein
MKAKLLAAKPWWCKHYPSLSKKLCSERETETETETEKARNTIWKLFCKTLSNAKTAEE